MEFRPGSLAFLMHEHFKKNEYKLIKIEELFILFGDKYMKKKIDNCAKRLVQAKALKTYVLKKNILFFSLKTPFFRIAKYRCGCEEQITDLPGQSKCKKHKKSPKNYEIKCDRCYTILLLTPAQARRKYCIKCKEEVKSNSGEKSYKKFQAKKDYKKKESPDRWGQNDTIDLEKVILKAFQEKFDIKYVGVT